MSSSLRHVYRPGSTPRLQLAVCFLVSICASLAFGALDDGLVAYYPFNGNANDASGHGLNGTVNNATFGTGVFGAGLLTNGSANSFVEVPANPLLSPTSAVSVSLWFEANSFSTGYSSLVYKAGAVPTNNGFTDRSYTLWAKADAGVHLASTPSGSSNQSILDAPPGSVPAGRFTNVVGIVDASANTMKVYVNGNLTASGAYGGSSIVAGNYPLRIGGPFFTLGDQSGLNGAIDDVRIYNRALSPQEVSSLAGVPAKPSRLEPTDIPARTGAKGLIVIAHGRADDVNGWVTNLANDIRANLSNPSDWDIVPYDWANAANTAPGPATLNARILGGALGQQINNSGYENIHFIGHSAGSWLVDTAASKLRELGSNAYIQTTFLDPYTPFGDGIATLGASSNFAENYLETRGWTWTNSLLSKAYNIDVTNLNPNSTGTLTEFHNWPHDWYEKTAANPNASIAHDWGFRRSVEGGFPGNHNDFGRGQSTTLGGVPPLPYETTPAVMTPVLDFGQLQNTRSDTGIIDIHDTNLLFKTGSPVWITSFVSVEQPVNLLGFQADFVSDAGSEGVLGVYWAGAFLGSLDERYVLDGMQNYVFELPDTFSAGTYMLSFRLDPYTSVQSQVSIDNVAPGFAPEPNVLWLLSLMAFIRRPRAARLLKFL